MLLQFWHRLRPQSHSLKSQTKSISHCQICLLLITTWLDKLHYKLKVVLPVFSIIVVKPRTLTHLLHLVSVSHDLFLVIVKNNAFRHICQCASKQRNIGQWSRIRSVRNPQNLAWTNKELNQKLILPRGCFRHLVLILLKYFIEIRFRGDWCSGMF